MYDDYDPDSWYGKFGRHGPGRPKGSKSKRSKSKGSRKAGFSKFSNSKLKKAKKLYDEREEKRMSGIKKKEERLFRWVLNLRLGNDEKTITEFITDNEAGLTKKYNMKPEQIRRIAKKAFQYSPSKTIQQIFEEAGIGALNKGSHEIDIEQSLEAACVVARDAGYTDVAAELFRNRLNDRLKKEVGIKATAKLVNNAWKAALRSEESESLSRTFSMPEPWPKPINGEKLANRIERELRRYVVLPDHASVAITLWAFHSHLLDANDISPFLALTSPTPGCGKTTLLTVLERLVLNPETASNITGPAFFHRVDKFQPTMLIDEADSYAKENPQLGGILNSSNRRRTAYVGRVKARYSTWCAKCIAMIGLLQRTWQERSIEIRLFKKKSSEVTEKVSDDSLVRELKNFPSKLCRWSVDHLQGVKKQRPTRLAELTDREFENWWPLLAIAQEIGKGWSKRAMKAAIALSTSTKQRYADTHEAIRLLTDIRLIFKETATEKLWSAELVTALRGLEDSFWTEKRLTTHRLAGLLRAFDIRPQQIWKSGNRQGYAIEQFGEAWERYLTSRPPRTKASQGRL